MPMACLQVGGASIDITPENTVPLSGYPTTVESPVFRDGPRNELSNRVNDPLRVRSLVFSDGETTVAVVASDLLNVYHKFSETVREGVSDLPIDEIVTTATHTHSAPYMPGILLEINPFLSFSTDVSRLVETICEGFIRSIRTAYNDLESATLRIGRATNDITPVNRRDENGLVDPELLVLHILQESGEEMALVNFACHPVCLSANTAAVSADFPSTLYQEVDEALNDGLSLFVNGAAGDINPRDIGDRYDDEFGYLEEIGSEVAETALTALEDARGSSQVKESVSASHYSLDLPLREISDPKQLRASSQELIEKIDRLKTAGENDAAFDRRWDRLYTEELLNIADLDTEIIPATVQYVEVGNIGLVSFPGEAFVEHGLDVKGRSSADHLIVAGYANEYVGYLPTLSEFEDSGYEVRTCKVTAEAVNRVREAAFNLVE